MVIISEETGGVGGGKDGKAIDGKRGGKKAHKPEIGKVNRDPPGDGWPTALNESNSNSDPSSMSMSDNENTGKSVVSTTNSSSYVSTTSASASSSVNVSSSSDVPNESISLKSPSSLFAVPSNDDLRNAIEMHTTTTASKNQIEWMNEQGARPSVSTDSSSSAYESTVETTEIGRREAVTIISDVKGLASDIASTMSELPPPLVGTLIRGERSGSISRTGTASSFIRADVELIEQEDDVAADAMCTLKKEHFNEQHSRRIQIAHLKYGDDVNQSSGTPVLKAGDPLPSIVSLPSVRTQARKMKPVARYQTEIQTPLVLRCNSLKTAQVHFPTYDKQPIHEVVHLHSEQGTCAVYEVAPSLAAPKFCTETLTSTRVHWAETPLLYRAPTEEIGIVLRPPIQSVKACAIERRLRHVDLLLPPEGPLQAPRLEPTWYSISYILTHGKHLAVPYRIPYVPVHRVKRIKADIGKITYLNAKMLYREAKLETMTTLSEFKAHPITLTTVELQDPECVQWIHLDQKAIERPLAFSHPPPLETVQQSNKPKPSEQAVRNNKVDVKQEPSFSPKQQQQKQSESSWPMAVVIRPPQSVPKSAADYDVIKVDISPSMDNSPERNPKNTDSSAQPVATKPPPTNSRLLVAPCRGTVVRSNPKIGGLKLVVDAENKHKPEANGSESGEAHCLTHHITRHRQKIGDQIVEFEPDHRYVHTHSLFHLQGNRALLQTEKCDLHNKEDDDEDNSPDSMQSNSEQSDIKNGQKRK